jgi:Domain of unknown function (DUF4190)
MTLPGGALPIDQRAPRPERGWYVAAVVVAAIGLVAGASGFAFGVGSIFRDQPKVTIEFEAGSPTVVSLHADKRYAIYVGVPWDTSERQPAVCTAEPVDGGTVSLHATSNGWSFSDDRTSWEPVYRMTVDQDGRYQLTCRPSDDNGGPAHYGVGGDPDIGKALATMAISVGIGGLAMVTGGVLALVGRRRRANHRRLQLEQQPAIHRPVGEPGSTQGRPPYPPYVYPPPFNTYAILALVSAVAIFPPLGVYFGYKAKKQIARTGERGIEFATAGLVIGWILTVFYGLFLIVWFGFVGSAIMGSGGGS